MGVVGEDVVHDPLHVPGVRTARHVPVARSKGVHGGHGVPLNSNGQTNEESQTNHHAGAMGPEEEAGLRGLVFTAVGPAAVAFVVANGIDADGAEERDGEPNQSAPRAVQVFAVPNTSLKPSGHLIERPHGTDQHGPGVPALGDHAGYDERHHAGQESTPVSDVPVVAVFRGDAQLVDDRDAVEVPQRAGKGHDPSAKRNHQWERISIEAA